MDDLRIVTGANVEAILHGRELELLELVRNVYLAHRASRTVLPHATFLRFPQDPANRIIALPAFVDDGAPVAGIKWIASFPGNVRAGLDRASAVLVLNSVETGRPMAILEGSLISLLRTAAGAVLAAQSLHEWQPEDSVGVIGCGQVNLHTLLMLLRVRSLDTVWAYELEPTRITAFAARIAAADPSVTVRAAENVRQVLERCPIVSFATMASVPHLLNASLLRPGQTILHISLRDIAPELILAADNVVDDVDHVCQANTSVHLAERRSGTRSFIRCTLADVLVGAARARRSPDATVIFSPFGLGVLDLAVGHYVYRKARETAIGVVVPQFCAPSWDRHSAAATSVAPMLERG